MMRRRVILLVVLSAMSCISYLLIYGYNIYRTNAHNAMLPSASNNIKPWTISNDAQAGYTGNSITNANHVMISSYMRSGSTFLGRILGWRTDSFYFFEPFWATHRKVYLKSNGTHCSYYKQQCSNMSREAFYEDLYYSLQFIEDIYSCKFATYGPRISYRIKHHSYASLVGHSWQAYRDCEKLNKTECLQTLVPVCSGARHRVVKLLRIDLELSSKLLTKIPNLKIVQLFRDPRGSVNSHIHTKWYPVHAKRLKELEDDIQVLCDRMRSDIATAKRLVKLYPGRVKIVQYEDFDDPMLKAKRLYEFLGMEFSSKTKELIHTVSKGKGNAGNHPFSYRNDLNWTSIELLNKHCSDVYKQLNYVEFRNENDLRNFNISAIRGNLTYSL